MKRTKDHFQKLYFSPVYVKDFGGIDLPSLESAQKSVPQRYNVLCFSRLSYVYKSAFFTPNT